MGRIFHFTMFMLILRPYKKESSCWNRSQEGLRLRDLEGMKDRRVVPIGEIN